MKRTLISVAAALVLAAACGDAGNSTAAPGDERATTLVPATDQTVTPVTPPPAPDAEVPAGLAPMVAAARADLAERTGATEMVVVTAEFVVWPDGSLGCPQPDMAYIQVLSEGYRIVLDVAGVRYHYHGGGATEPFLCESPAPPANPGGGDS